MDLMLDLETLDTKPGATSLSWARQQSWSLMRGLQLLPGML